MQKKAMPDLQWYPKNLRLIKYELNMHVFVYSNCLYLGSDLRNAHLLLVKDNGEIHRN